MSTGKSIQKGIAKAKVGAKKLGQAIKRDTVKVGNVYKKGGQKAVRVAKMAGKVAGATKAGKKVKSAIQAVKNA